MITPEQLSLHAAWVRGEPGGQRLVLRSADLRRADLRCAVLNGADLSGAVLRGADLSGAVLSDADLRRADLRDADLSDADLRGADLRGAVLRGADLHGADLRDADLRGADLRGADLSDAVGLAIATDAPERLRVVAQAALAEPDALHMGRWHSCDTTHCVAGWAIAQAGEPGRLLEAAMGAEMAGLMLLGTEAHVHFFDDAATARAWLQEVLER
jgi:uncharacterized protein YjbI with pentapeptide repeats